MSSAAWFLADDEEVVAATTVVIEADPDPGLIRGIVTPFRREKTDVANDKGEALIIAHARQILGTRCADGMGTMGELRWDPFFGSLLYKLRHQNIKPVIRYQARAYVVEALARWEPRLRVLAVDVADEVRRFVIRTAVRIVDGRPNSTEPDGVITTIVDK